jgi:hypothetical protein
VSVVVRRGEWFGGVDGLIAQRKRERDGASKRERLAMEWLARGSAANGPRSWISTFPPIWSNEVTRRGWRTRTRPRIRSKEWLGSPKSDRLS